MLLLCSCALQATAGSGALSGAYSGDFEQYTSEQSRVIMTLATENHVIAIFFVYNAILWLCYTDELSSRTSFHFSNVLAENNERLHRQASATPFYITTLTLWRERDLL